MTDYPFLVRIPETAADETTLGEWLEIRNVQYVSRVDVSPASTTLEFSFASKQIADEFARNFVA
ncbi:hypothetical protein GCM10011497_09610 [Elstera cyanobacteriorum]|uniref:Uncharacterized protein n=1 Tax=Elstera cyanobacteriorum TaxID=2022747 RepID=A0A255XMM2_9PROT|nr:hypothetical protein [Elstera cyanobacteriorum]OYQ18206.1 hypothetical protein CHR90_14745 [Elstera cyanobacteriorum]GFZ83070.1 hypothetical protein GCM10011497_09610 [Elstera cyanobacteriorum]